MAITIQNHELQVTLKALGATMTSITDSQGVEYLWQGDPTYWGGASSYFISYMRKCSK